MLHIHEEYNRGIFGSGDIPVPARFIPARLGRARPGPCRPDPSRTDRSRYGSERIGSAWPFPARPVPARPGLSQPRPAQLGPGRPGLSLPSPARSGSSQPVLTRPSNLSRNGPERDVQARWTRPNRSKNIIKVMKRIISPPSLLLITFYSERAVADDPRPQLTILR